MVQNTSRLDILWPWSVKYLILNENLSMYVLLYSFLTLYVLDLRPYENPPDLPVIK